MGKAGPFVAVGAGVSKTVIGIMMAEENARRAEIERQKGLDE